MEHIRFKEGGVDLAVFDNDKKMWVVYPKTQETMESTRIEIKPEPIIGHVWMNAVEIIIATIGICSFGCLCYCLYKYLKRLYIFENLKTPKGPPIYEENGGGGVNTEMAL